MDRKADPQTQLMIDEAILDYVVYTAIKALLENSSPRDNDVSTAAIIHARLPLHMVGCT